MEKVIEIGGKPVAFKATASTPRRYKQRTGREILDDFAQLAEAFGSSAGLAKANLDVFADIAYVMAQQADPSIPSDPDDWLDQFEMFSIYEIMPQLIELWGLQMQTSVEPAKKK